VGSIASGWRSPREWRPALILAPLLSSSASANVVIKEKSEEVSGTATGGQLMKAVTEVISITTSSAPAGSFNVTAGYTLQKRRVRVGR
jgi:hypothetical protein